MDKRLTEILARVLARRDEALLGDDEYRYLEALVAPPAAPAASEAKPLWAWAHEQLSRWGAGGFELARDLELGSEVNTLLADAGAPGAYETSAARWAAPVTRKGLKRALTRHLASPTEGDDSVRGIAALLVGLAGFEELVPQLVAGLAGARDGRWSWWDDAITGSLQSLTMLDAPAMRELCPLYARHDTLTFRAPARAWALRHPEVIGPAALAKVLAPADGDGTGYFELLARYPDAVRAAVEAGLKLESKVVELLGDSDLTWSAARGLGVLAVTLEWKEPFTKWLAHACAEVRAGMALGAAWRGEKWAIKAVRARVKEATEDDDDVRACLAAAELAGSTDVGALGAALESDDAERRLGAAWACLGVAGTTDKLLARLRDDDKRVARAAECVWALNTDGDAREYVDAAVTGYCLHADETACMLALRALEHKGIALPPLAEDIRLDLLGPAAGGYDEARRFYAEHRRELMRWAGENWMGSLQVALFPEHARVSIETALNGTTSWSEAVALWLALAAVGGPQTAAGRLRGALLGIESGRTITLDEEDFLPAVIVALTGDNELRVRALSALGTAGARAEPVLAYVLENLSTDDHAVKTALQSVARSLEHVSDPTLTAIRELVGAPDQPLTPSVVLDWIDYKVDTAGRRQLVDRAALPDTPTELAFQMAELLLHDEDSEVALAALRCIAQRGGGAPWVAQLALARSYSGDWQARQLAAELLANAGGDAALSRLIALTTDDDNDVQNAAANGLTKLAANRAELGLAVLDIRDPDRVKTRYGLTEEVNYSNDTRAEALRLLLLGLDARKDGKLARARKGQRVVVTRVKTDSDHGQAASARPLTATEFESLALYLRVDFADDETGSIVASVEQETTGEVLNALLQSDSLVVATAAWS
jgi:HEAT repeat protein